MSEKLSLRWNDFQENINVAFGSLRDDKELSDVTLVCEDGQQFEAHKVILATSSPFFKNMLIRNKHQHPLIYMRGVKSEDLMAMVDFLYFGEANVCKENLEHFLELAAELSIKGLTKESSIEEDVPSPVKMIYKEQPETVPEKSNEEVSDDLQNETLHEEKYSGGEIANNSVEVKNEASVEKVLFSGGIYELDEKVKSLMGKSQNMVSYGKSMSFASVCNVCHKEGQNAQIRNHIEVNHLEGVSLPCNYCDKTFRSRLAGSKHNTKHHSKNQL